MTNLAYKRMSDKEKFEYIQKLESQLEKQSVDMTNFELTTMWLCGYVIDLHEFRNGIFRTNRNTHNIEAVMDYVVGQFPMLQGSSNHSQFEHFGKQVNIKNINESIKSVMKMLREKTGLE